MSSQFSSENTQLQYYFSQKTSVENAKAYQEQIVKAEQNSSSQEVKQGKILKKEETTTGAKEEKVSLSTLWIGIVVLLSFIGLIIFVKKRRK